MGAYGLLEACGGIDKWSTSPRAVSQVAIMTWYIESNVELIRFMLTFKVGRGN